MATLYRHFDSSGNLLYVGCSLNWFQRTIMHSQQTSWFGEIVRIELEHFETREQALRAEWLAISSENPLYNKIAARGRRSFRPPLDPDEALRELLG
jgi:hypothetical protein